MISVVHIITDLDTGGAERMLQKLLTRRKATFDVQVVSLTDVGCVGEEIAKLGIPVRGLGMKPGFPDLIAVMRLTRWLREARPQVVQTWMYHADLVGGIAARLARDIKVVWNVRHSNLDPRSSRARTIRIARACAAMSPWLPARIVCCSEAARRAHVALGYDARKMVLIPNGFDLDVFRPDQSARASIRAELNIPQDAPIVGLSGRFHPDKDHENFVRAAQALVDRFPDVYYLLWGEGISWSNLVLANRISEAGNGDRWRLLGVRHDVTRLTAALDISVSSSAGEGFPNVIGESMACEVPCVVTDVGDSAWIVGNTGIVVPARNPELLADGCARMLEMDSAARRELGAAARERIQRNFALSAIAEEYEQLYQDVLA